MKIVDVFWAKVPKRLINFYLWTFFLVSLLGLSSWLFYTHSLKKTWPQYGSLAEDEQFPAEPETAYRSLDLKIAAQYHFSSDQVKKIESLGTQAGSDLFKISFQVPADRLTEYGLMSLPTLPRPARGYPVIILCHGYAAPQVYSTTKSYLADMEEYSKAGFAVIKPDLRGQGLSLNSGQSESAYYSMAYNTDLLSLIAAVNKTDYIDHSRISLWGHSMGAYIALRAAVLSSDVKNLILLSAPTGSVSDMYHTYIASSDRRNPLAWDTRQAVLLRYGTPDSNPKFWLSTSPLTYLGQLKAHVQIHVGKLDGIVPPHFSADLDRALSASHQPHEYFIYQYGRHGLVAERATIYERSLRLLGTGNSD